MNWVFGISVVVILCLLTYMSDSDGGGDRLIASIICGLLMLLTWVSLSITLLQPEIDKLNNCQQHLPRSEKCVMIAVPEYEINKGE